MTLSCEKENSHFTSISWTYSRFKNKEYLKIQANDCFKGLLCTVKVQRSCIQSVQLDRKTVLQ